MNHKFSHLDAQGDPGMVDISHKATSVRIAEASGRVELPLEVMQALAEHGFETKKGSITQTAIIAATMAVKNTFQVIPLCHQIPIASCKINIEAKENNFEISCRVKTQGQTGVEMEALHGVSVAALTIYDMCKAMSQDIIISNIRLEQKSGGKSDYERTS